MLVRNPHAEAGSIDGTTEVPLDIFMRNFDTLMIGGKKTDAVNPNIVSDHKYSVSTVATPALPAIFDTIGPATRPLFFLAGNYLNLGAHSLGTIFGGVSLYEDAKSFYSSKSSRDRVYSGLAMAADLGMTAGSLIEKSYWTFWLAVGARALFKGFYYKDKIN